LDTQCIAILLAVYEPNEEWLVELLQSLNAQTYPSIKLYVRDDASPHYPMERLEALLKQHITAFPFVLHRNEQNLGSNQTFAALVTDCNEPLIAFCDQDDVWLADKLTNTHRLFTESPLHPILVCTNVSVMDGDGKEIAARMEEHRKRHIFLRGTGLAPSLINRNFVMGCTILMQRDFANQCLPFPSGVVHDHYLAFCAAAKGALDFLEEPQLRYRVYGGNQTGVMTGVSTKEDYFHRRIEVFETRVQRFSAAASIPELDQALAWCAARRRNFYREKGGFKELFHLRKFNFVTSMFELFALRLPTPLFRFAIRLIQQGVL
jgi:glycosyltransferase involved in cell wall biosynthesis